MTNKQLLIQFAKYLGVDKPDQWVKWFLDDTGIENNNCPVKKTFVKGGLKRTVTKNG